MFDVSLMIQAVKKYNAKKLQLMCENDIELAENKNLDSNKIKTILIVSYLMKTFKLVMIIFNISYIVGMIWLILCEAHKDYYHGTENLEQETFLEVYEIDQRTIQESVILVMYFAFTSLSTVGFGDFHPKNSFERLWIALILLFGVATFSYVLGEFLDIVNKFTEFDREYEEAYQLDKFFGTLQKFNENIPISEKLTMKIQEFFSYKWSEDKNLAL